MANRGNAFYALGEYEKAAKDYLAAHSCDPEDDGARAIEALAYMFTEEHDKAHELSTALCNERPQVSKAHAIRIRTSPKSMSHLDLADSVPKVLREDPEILMALVHRAQSEGALDHAERYGRRACQSSPDWAEAELSLSATLLQVVMLRLGYPIAPDSTPSLPEDCSAEVAEAREILTKLIERLGDGSNGSRATAHFNRAASLGLLGDWPGRLTDLHDAQRIDPSADFAFALGHSLDANGDPTSAIRVMQDQCLRAGSRRLRLFLAMSLRDRDDPGDRQAAVEVLREDRSSEEDTAYSSRADLLQFLTSLLHQSEGFDAANNYVDTLPETGNCSSALQSLLRAELLLKQGERDRAKKIALEQYALREGAASSEARLLARILQRLGEPALALSLWERLAQPPGAFTPDVFELLQCARQAGRDAVVLERCAALREKGFWSKELASFQIDTLLKYDEHAEAIPLLVEYVERVPADLHARLNLSILGIKLDRLDLVDTEPTSYPSASEVDPKLGRAVVGVLATGPHTQAALDYAYEFVRRHPDRPDAHQALIALSLPGLGKRTPLKQPVVVAPGVAVEIQPEGGRPKRWIVIEDAQDPPPSASRQEFAATSKLGLAFIGKRVGEKGDLPLSFSTIPATVERMTTKYDYRAQQSLSSFETRFPEVSFVTRVSAPKPTSTPMSIREVLGEELVELLSRSERHREETKELYTSYAVPIAAVAGLVGKNYLETHGLLLGSPDVELRCFEGQAEELGTAITLTRITDVIVVDESALATLFFLEQWSMLASVPAKCLIPEAFLGNLRSWLERNPANGGEKLTLGTTKGEPEVSRVTAEVVRQQREAVETYLSFLSASFETFGGGALADASTADRRWLDEFSPGTAHALALAAKRGLPLWTDDFCVARLAPETDRTWTHAVAFALRQAGSLEQNEVDEISVRLNQWGYRFVGMCPSAVARALELADWDMEQEPAASALAHFSLSMDPQVLLGFLCGVLRIVWASARDELRVPITIRILEHAARQPNSRRVLLRAAQQADRIFRFEPILAARVSLAIETWLSGTTGSGLIVPPSPGQLLALASDASRCPRCNSENPVIVIRLRGQSVVCCQSCRPT